MKVWQKFEKASWIIIAILILLGVTTENASAAIITSFNISLADNCDFHFDSIIQGEAGDEIHFEVNYIFSNNSTLVNANIIGDIVGASSAVSIISDTAGLPPPYHCEASARLIVNGVVHTNFYKCVGDFCTKETEAPVPPAMWLADVCEPYADGKYNNYGQMTIGTDKGTTLFTAASSDGPWTPIQVNGPAWVLHQDALQALANEQGLADIADLWLMTTSPEGDGKANRLGSMITDRVGRWERSGSCTPVEALPENTP